MNDTAQIGKGSASLREWLNTEPYTLAMSSGFFGFYAHAGFLAALEDAGLPPIAATGSSAGALVAGVWASGRSMNALQESLFSLTREQFWDPAPGFGLLRGHLFAAKLEEFLEAKTFESCRVPLRISVFELARLRTRVIESGPLAAAIHGSCCFPGLLQPVKVEERWVIDGGVLDRPGLAGTPSGERVLYHHLSSRSRVRKHFKRFTGIPRRDQLLAVQINDLPRLGPNRLELGPSAFSHAYAAVNRALDTPMNPDESVLMV
jgi:NTE family protein